MIDKREQIMSFLQNQILNTPRRLGNYTENGKGEEYPKRDVFIKIQQYVDDFMNGKFDRRWIILPGLRGVGKTTLLSQLYFYIKNNYIKIDGQRIIYISLDEVKSLLDVPLNELLDAYFEILRIRIEELNEPVFFLLDEVQYDPDWAKIIKILWDKTRNLFILCSGSSAISLQTNPDVARRSVFEKVYPVSFGEFLMIKYKIYPEPSLRKELKSAIYGSNKAEDAFMKLKGIESKALISWSKAPKFAQLEYLETGTLPFAINAPNKEQVYDTIDQLLDKIISKDIQSLGKFDSDTLGLIKRILYIVAESDTISFNKLEQILPIKRITIMNVFDVLEKAELLIRISAYGANTTGAKKPTKYLFMSPAIRQALMGMTGLIETIKTREGKLIEDIMGIHIYREFLTPGAGNMSFDSAEHGADFILQIADTRQLAIEMGRGEKGVKQLLNTMGKIKCNYGIAFSKSGLELFQKENIVKIPSYYLLLM